jgi:glycosyltransferase involved in cell wall biosynthesis
MRLGVGWDPQSSAANYRALQPLQAMQQRGHEVVWPITLAGELREDVLAGCDLVHTYRLNDGGGVIRRLAERGVAITWDNDDDYSTIPEDTAFYREHGGEMLEDVLAQSLEVAGLAQIVTVPSQRLADRYRNHGIQRLAVIENCVLDGFRPRRRHDGFVIGWIAGVEHQGDAERLRIADVLRQVQASHPAVHVECIGVDLKLSERYHHSPHVPFGQLPSRMAGFDLGIAPLADIPFNHARSSIKVKEYAASGVPWLASDLTPYHGLGPEQGGQLVTDEGWLQALDALISNPDALLTLTKNGRAWAKTQRIDSVADQWEAVFAQAIALKRG